MHTGFLGKEAPKLVSNSYCALRAEGLRRKINHSIAVTYCNGEIREKKLISLVRDFTTNDTSNV